MLAPETFISNYFLLHYIITLFFLFIAMKAELFIHVLRKSFYQSLPDELLKNQMVLTFLFLSFTFLPIDRSLLIN